MRTPSNQPKPKANQTKLLSKRSPHQLLFFETHEGFLKTKAAFFTQITILWGLTDENAIPQTPDPELLQEFHWQFSQDSEFESVASNTSAESLIKPQEIIELKKLHIGHKKIGFAIVHISEFFIQYTNAIRAILGSQIWCPDLKNTPYSLYNKACQISAIITSQQISSGGEYEYMSADLSYCNDLVFLQKA
ncbi:hypothetical protein O181_080226 [Austropuccinia psidii MF-1]|uniref:Uncharacterized protein n=1 Tax=Austropuccinia psidii MF-1 TaxID=1389203 RepID=A0A9Q3FHT6_9BASI|nr:hypothetical protein [Austropuccinia psidii MF-1]